MLITNVHFVGPKKATLASGVIEPKQENLVKYFVYLPPHKVPTWRIRDNQQQSQQVPTIHGRLPPSFGEHSATLQMTWASPQRGWCVTIADQMK